VIFHPEQRISTPYKEWNFSGDMTRMPEFTAPALGNKPNRVSIVADIPANANGVLYFLGAFSAGLTTYMKDGSLCYEYNLFQIMRTRICATDKLPAGKHMIEVETTYVMPKPGGPLKIVMKVNGKEANAVTKVNGKEVTAVANVQGLDVGPGIVPISAPLLFTANDCLDIGADLGSPVSLDYYEKAPFKFNGKIETVHVQYTK
jgi:arylsulfatase